jgi:CPA2 family monovalent cation:H+ antiporter-2
MADEILVEFSFFIIFALLGTVLALRLRQPYVVGLLVLGMIAGPNVLSLVKSEELIRTFFELGAILLLFTVGIEFSVSRLLKSGLRAILVTASKMMVLFLLGYEVALYFGLDLTSALFAGAMTAVTSTAILFKMASEKGNERDSIMPLLISMLIVEDLVAVAALTFFSSLGAGAPTYEDKVYSVLISLGMLGAFYLFVRRHAAEAITRLTSQFNEETLIFVSFSLCLVMAYTADIIGLSPAIGAFLAGSIIATLPTVRKIEKTIRPLLLTFSAFFFLSIGMQIDPAAVMDNIALSCALAAAFVVGCFAAVYILLYTTGATSRRALLGASSMVVMGEFTLIIAATATGDTRAMLLSVGSFGVVATAIVSSFLLSNQERLLRIGRAYMPPKVAAAARGFAGYLSGLIRDFSPNGGFWRVAKVCWRCVLEKLASVAVILIMIWAARFAASFFGVSTPAVRAAILALGSLPLIYYAIQIIRDQKPLLDALSRTIARHRRNAKDESIILRDLAIAAFFLLLALLLPEIEAYLMVPSIFLWMDEIAVAVAFIFLWDLANHAHRIRKDRRGRVQ